MKKSLVNVPLERVEKAILSMRGERIILDADLAELYGVENRALIQAVKRNANRFPKDFVFQLTKVEFDSLRTNYDLKESRLGSPSIS
jgi:ORF6N domain